jgi:ketosteroid isomerase-like protein
MSSSLTPILLLAGLCAGTTHAVAEPAATTAPAAHSPEAEVLAREHAWLVAIEQGDADATRDILADDFVLTFPNGGSLNKAQAVAGAHPRRAGEPQRHITTQGTVAHVRSDVVVLVGRLVENRTDAQGQRRERHAFYTDTWVRDGATWRVLTSHMSSNDSKP